MRFGHQRTIIRSILWSFGNSEHLVKVNVNAYKWIVKNGNGNEKNTEIKDSI
jgi:hypothetical protein